MNKKDRVAIVLTIFYLFFLIFVYMELRSSLILWALVPVSYWSYRFIRDDISFLNSKEK